MENLIKNLKKNLKKANFEKNSETVKEGRVMVMISHDNKGKSY